MHGADLCFVETECRRDLDAPGPSEILVEVEFLLQLGQLLVGEVGAAEVGLVRMKMMMMMMRLMMVGRRDVVMRAQNAVVDAHVTGVVKRPTCPITQR